MRNIINFLKDIHITMVSVGVLLFQITLSNLNHLTDNLFMRF